MKKEDNAIEIAAVEHYAEFIASKLINMNPREIVVAIHRLSNPHLLAVSKAAEAKEYFEICGVIKQILEKRIVS